MDADQQHAASDVTVEIRRERSDGSYTSTCYTASAAEVRAIPYLLEARSALQQNDPRTALGCVLEAVRMTQGENAIFGVLDQAKLRYQLEHPEHVDDQSAPQSVSILGERGEAHLYLEASCDGSSLICERCRGVISITRMQSHRRFFCPALNHHSLDDDDDLI